MSIKVMTLAWTAMVGDHTDKLVLLALSDNANDEGECRPSLTNIATRCEVHRSTAVRSLNSLEKAGHISRMRGVGKNSSYMVHPLVAACDQSQPATSRSVRTDPSQRATSPPFPSPPITPSPISPSRNRQEPSVLTRKTVSDEPPPSNLNVEAWHRWVQYRQEIRRPIKPVSIPAAQRKLAGFGSDQAAVVEQSIAEGYQGLFPLKDRHRRQQESAEWR